MPHFSSFSHGAKKFNSSFAAEENELKCIMIKRKNSTKKTSFLGRNYLWHWPPNRENWVILNDALEN